MKIIQNETDLIAWVEGNFTDVNAIQDVCREYFSFSVQRPQISWNTD